MLAIVSDLHFCDGSANNRNVDPDAFTLALSEIYKTASDLATARGGAGRLDLVFLGDVFDLLRTERWFETRDGKEVPVSERPWGSAAALDGAAPPPAVIAHAHAILDEILEENSDALAALSGASLAPPANVEVRRIYFPGNHDRLYLHDARLRDRCRKALKSVDETQLAGEGIYAHHLALPEYGLLARHGHEWDDWNFERYTGAAPATYRDEDYLPAPIGDAITTELAARLPYELARCLKGTRLSAEEQQDVIERIQHIEDVRPTLAAFHWAFYEADRINGGQPDAGKKADLSEAINATVRKLATNFRDLDFFKAWEERHHRLLHLDAAGELKDVLDGLAKVSAQTVGTVAQLFERYLDERQPRDTCRDGAALEDLRAVGNEGLRFVVYGHTHDPLQAALHAGATRDIYFNSGTFRETVFRTDDNQGFIGWDRLTYLTFFSQEEQRGWNPGYVGPGFDVWTGNRNR
jgi:UDP-2,3-diacylglucosamine pyrophosphatase LpxH